MAQEAGGGMNGLIGALVRADGNAMPGAGGDIDVRPGAALTDQPKFRPLFDQARPQGRALADQDERFRVDQSLGQQAVVLKVVVPDRNLMAAELGERGQSPQRVEPFVEDRDLHHRALME